MNRTLAVALLVALVALVVAACSYDGTVVLPTAAGPSHDVIGFHGDRKKLGWSSNQPDLHRARVRAGMVKLWESPPLGEVTLPDGSVRAPHLYASPLYVSALDFETPLRRGTTQVVLAATSNGFVYAIDANAKGLAGTILWHTQLTYPEAIPKLDGGVALGVLSTPILDRTASP